MEATVKDAAQTGGKWIQMNTQTSLWVDFRCLHPWKIHTHTCKHMPGEMQEGEKNKDSNVGLRC